MRFTAAIMLVGSVASLGFAGTAQATHFTGWYAGIEGGINSISDAKVGNDTIDPFWGGGFAPTVAKFGAGGAVLGTAGWSWPTFRVEGELGYRWNDLNDFLVFGTNYTGGGKLNEFSTMINFLWNPALSSTVDFSLGAGLGGDSINYKNDSGWHTVPIHDTDFVFAWQLIAGLSYHVPALSGDLFVNYRYFNADSPTFTEYDGASRLHDDSYEDLHKHTFTIGIRFH